MSRIIVIVKSKKDKGTRERIQGVEGPRVPAFHLNPLESSNPLII